MFSIKIKPRPFEYDFYILATVILYRAESFIRSLTSQNAKRFSGNSLRRLYQRDFTKDLSMSNQSFAACSLKTLVGKLALQLEYENFLRKPQTSSHHLSCLKRLCHLFYMSRLILILNGVGL